MSPPLKLHQLVAGADALELIGDPEVEISDLVYDSRDARPGALFFCARGQAHDRHDFAPDAVRRGAAALVVERPLELPVPQVRVRDARAAMAPVAVAFWGDPTAELRVAGITGTNGKTTTAFLLRAILESRGIRTGLLGTVKRIVGGSEEVVERTTPEAVDLHRTFRRMLDRGDRACVMEVSSHALALQRTAGLRFHVAAFTNLTQDHLDFHGDMERYFLAKRGLFATADAPSAAPGTAVINVDDEYGRRLAEEIRGAGQPRLLIFSASGAEADFRAVESSFDASGSRFRCLAPDGEAEVEMALPGHFNVENALAALACGQAMGIPTAEGAAALRAAGRVPGRFEPVNEGQPFAVLVDYAHTPDSLDNLLRAARRITDRQVIVVFGCGGDRDRDKRPLMGRIATELADVAIVTSDNPRSEDPEAIIAEIVAGIPGAAAGEAGGGAEVKVEPDRRAAIALALQRTRPGDTVVIAGKGHEQGQEFEGGRKVPFDDRAVAREELLRLANPTA